MAKTLTADEQKALNKRLLDAAEMGDVAVIKNTLKDGAEIDVQSKEQPGRIYGTSLHHAAWLGHAAAAIALLEAGADVDAEGSLMRTPLLYAAYIGYEDVVKVLLAVGANPDLKDKNGKTTMESARENNKTALADYMQSIADDPSKRPTPQEVGLDMNARNESLKKLGKPVAMVSNKPVAGPKTAKVIENRQRQAALDDPEQGI